MGAPKALSRCILDEEKVKADRKKCTKYDQCGLGHEAVYLPSKLAPRQCYIPYSALTHVYKRVAVSPGSGKAFLTPVLYIVFCYDDGNEEQVYFKYLRDADKLFDQLQDEHPEIILISPKSLQEKEEQEKREKEAADRQLTSDEEKLIRKLDQAKNHLKKCPGIYEKLVVTAKIKRTVDLIKPIYQCIAGVVLIVGALLVIAGAFIYKSGGDAMLALVCLMLGLAAMFVMANSKILPTPDRTKKQVKRNYQQALEDMTQYTAKLKGFPIPACYAHPYTLDRLIRSIKEGRAGDLDSAMDLLKEELKAADNTVALSGREYQEIVMIKPLFLVTDYQ